MAHENDRGQGPSAGATTPDPGTERFHMWASRPLLRSILWTPRGPDSETTGLYDVFITQSALASLLDHVRSAPEDERPFGLLAGDLCEDPDDESRYVLIREICRSRVSLNGQDGVEQQHTLVGPAAEVTVVGNRQAEFGLYFPVNILQGGRDLYPGPHREAQAVRLAYAVIGVLPQDDHLHPIERGVLEGVENFVTRREHPLAGAFLRLQKSAQLGHIGLFEFRAKVCQPTWLEANTPVPGGRRFRRCQLQAAISTTWS